MKSLWKMAVLALVFSGANAAYAEQVGTTYNEIGDAGQTLATAQTVSGTGLLTRINGTIGSNNADLYFINITNAVAFSASTVGAATFDTQLFIFTASGLGVVGNDDFSVGIRQSQIGPGIVGLMNGSYYLGISSSDHDPVNAAGLEIFPDTPFTGALLPITGRGPLAGFAGIGATGAYGINLTGASFVGGADPIPEPTTMLLLGTGLAGVAARVRRRRKQ